MSKSIISNRRECVICGTIFNLHRHHIFYGTGNRKKAEEVGAWCYLCGNHHNLTKMSVHANRAIDLKLKMHAQEILEDDYGWDRAQFIDAFGRSYL